MYIAGLTLPSQSIEALVILSTADYLRCVLATTRKSAVLADSKGGRVRPESMPSTLLGRVVTPIHAVAIFIPPLVYVGALALNRFQPPEWIDRFAFPIDVDPTWRNAARVVACAASFALKGLTDSTFKHLGDQWHPIGRRERPRIVKTGPYAWVRHPGYSSVLFQEALWSVMFWSYAPLASLGVTAAAFSVKMPIEESLIQKDDAVRDEYQQYMKEVPARILPYVW